MPVTVTLPVTERPPALKRWLPGPRGASGCPVDMRGVSSRPCGHAIDFSKNLDGSLAVVGEDARHPWEGSCDSSCGTRPL